MTKLMTCPMCGTEFDPVTNPACGACPLHGGCSTVCCPSCGYSTINPDQSKLVKMFAVLFPKRATENQTSEVYKNASSTGKNSNFGSLAMPTNRTLADVKPGDEIKVAGFASTLSPARLAHLQAYGLVQGYPVRVVQQKPVTVVQVDFVELALEDELARGVWVEGGEGEGGEKEKR
jgi:Fe2+ transport system protein FeoA